MNDREMRQWIQKSLGVNPKDLNKYRIALTVRQFEVLELFGDAVLGFVVSEYLVTKYFIDEPGWFTHARAELVENKNLTRIANKIGLASVAIIHSKSNREQVTDKVVADMLEALIGAVYLDQGLKKCQEVIRKLFDLEKETIVENFSDTEILSNPQKARQSIEERVKEDIFSSLEQKNPVSALQEFLIKKGESPPEYSEIGRAGEPHEPLFTIEATCRFRGRQLVAEGTGRTIKIAKKSAAQNLLVKVIALYKEAWSKL